MEGEIFFNNRDLNVFFWISHVRRWDIEDPIHFRSSRRMSHSKETFFDSNRLWRRFCFFFILNNFIRESEGRDFWIKDAYGDGCSKSPSLLFSQLILLKHSLPSPIDTRQRPCLIKDEIISKLYLQNKKKWSSRRSEEEKCLVHRGSDTM